MELILGLILTLGTIAIVGLLGLDTFQNLKPITKNEIEQSLGTRPSETKKQIRGLFNRG
tara:strand:+ start:22 stop:198 length:177 start_codon:yes stop_codon:yes gene_type:complete